MLKKNVLKLIQLCNKVEFVYSFLTYKTKFLIKIKEI